MADQYSQNPDEELPEWLQELRDRGSIEPEENDSTPTNESEERASSEAENIQEVEEPSTLEEDPKNEPDWLLDIRRRHREENPLQESVAQQIDDTRQQSTNITSEIERESDDEATPTPILEIPAEPIDSKDKVDEIIKEEPEAIAFKEGPSEDQGDSQDEQAEIELASDQEAILEGEQDSSFDESSENVFPSFDPEAIDGGEISDVTKSLEDSLEDTAELQEIENSESAITQEENIEPASGPDDVLDDANRDVGDGLASPSNTVADEIEKSEAVEEFGEELIPEVDPGEQNLDAKDLNPSDHDELLSWLEKGDEKEDQPPESPSFSSENIEIAPGELPTWLAALQPETSSAKDDSDEGESPPISEDSQEEEGPLSGLRGVLPVEPEIVQFGRSSIPSGQSDFGSHQKMHVATFESVILDEGSPVDDFEKRIAFPMRVLRLLFAGLLFIAILFPLLTDSQDVTRLPVEIAPESISFYNQIELLPPDVPVLVAFEVAPSLYGEMQSVAGTVIGHLLDKQARLVFISTQATGPVLAERLLAQQFSSHPSIATKDYINLGYLSGGTAALRYFAEDPRNATLLPRIWDEAILAGIESVANFGIVLVISSDAEDARAWLEQVSPRTSDGIFAVSSAQAVPILIPYLQSNPVSLRALIGGLNGATNYESLRGQDGLGREYWDAYSYGLGAMVILILLGGLYGRLLQTRPERRVPAQESDDAAK